MGGSLRRPKTHLALLLTVALSATAGRAAWRGHPTPLDDGHLVVVRPDAFRTGDGGEQVDKAPGTLFGRAVEVAVGADACAPLDVEHDGTYAVWMRLSEAHGNPVTVTLLRLDSGGRQGAEVLKARIGDGAGSVERGGRAGYVAYRAQASTRESDIHAAATPVSTPLGEAADGAGEIGQELLDELDPDPRAKWTHAGRIETVDPKAPYYWWLAGSTELGPGSHELCLSGDGHVDSAFLTTATGLAYPFGADITAPPASYVRFRIDEAPEGGIAIAGTLRIHSRPWATRGLFNPDGMDGKDSVPHTVSGYTRWYRLQDMEDAPGFGGATAHLMVGVPAGARGATQFAVFPHGDAVLREFDWNEPEGRRISMRMDFRSHLSQLRTFRDHARGHYEFALTVTEGRFYPLTRGPLYFGNAWGYADGDAADYLVKTLRLLGFNCASAPDAVANRRRYGWTSHRGQYWPPTFMPYDEEASKERYDTHFRDAFARTRDIMEGVPIYQICDEPVEISRSEMTAPLWRFVPEAEGGPKWVDLAGESGLKTVRTDYRDCALEGKVTKTGYWFGFQVATGEEGAPGAAGAWRVGTLHRELPENVGARVGDGHETRLERPGAQILPGPTPFKIVYEQGTATLYIGGALIHRLDGLRPAGGFGFFGPAKGITELRIRPLHKDESIVAKASASSLLGGEASDDEVGDLLEELDGPAQPDWAKPKPLEQFVREDWRVTGGLPGAHEGFRLWAAQQGLEPSVFGKDAWDEVGMLTVPELVESDVDRRLFFWSRRYSASLTPKMFSQAAEAVRRSAPNKEMLAFVALSGHSLYMGGSLPLDMFQLGHHGGALMPGISDWMSMGGWRWDSHQAVAYSVAPYNAGARVYGGSPRSYPMMHCVWPSVFRAYTMLGNNVKYISYYNFGPSYMVTEGYWSDSPGSYQGPHLANNRTAQVDDILASAQMRRSRVAMLYAMSNEHWDASTSFADKRAAFLALSHEYYQPELVTEDHVADGVLEHYDALYVLDPIVSTTARQRIRAWLDSGGLLWACADALTRNEFNEPDDMLEAFGLKRTPVDAGERDVRLSAVDGTPVCGQDTLDHGIDGAWPGARVRAQYGDGRPAWLEAEVGKGRLVYHPYRCGLNYTRKAIRLGGLPVIWGEAGRSQLVLPLKEAGVARELALSKPCIVASPMQGENGTVIVLYNMAARPVDDVGVLLREDRAPRSVQVFDGMDLVDLPFAHKDGHVSMTLPSLPGGQMIVVRYTAAPTDPRPRQMRENATALLASLEPQDLAAGAWMAGFHPQWGMAARLPDLLGHEQPAVRRAAAESIERLTHADAADALAAQIAVEQDAHALGDELHALGRMGDERFPALARTALGHRRAFVRQQVVRGARAHLQQLGGDARSSRKVRQFADDVWRTAIVDPDYRVSSQAVPLAAAVAPGACVDMLVGESAQVPGRVRGDLISVVAQDDGLFAALLEAADPLPDDLLLVVARTRTDSRLVAMLTDRFAALAGTKGRDLVFVAAYQADPAFTRLVFERREELGGKVGHYLPWLLDKTFNAGLGSDLSAWESWLAERP